MTAILISLGVLLAGAAGSALLAPRPRAALAAALTAAAVAAGTVLVAVVPMLAGQQTAYSGMFEWPLPLGTVRLAVDGLSAWFLVSIAILTLAVAVYSWPYMQTESRQGSLPAHGSLLCLLIAALILVVIAADLVVFMLAWEAMTLSAFFLVSFYHRQAQVRRAAWMYLIVTHLGTALFVIPMFGVLAAQAQSSSFATFPAALEHCRPFTGTLVFLLGLIGFGTKAGLMPMHIWLPVAHPAAPTPVSALLSGVVIKIGIYGMLRLLSWLPPLPVGCGIAMLLLGVVSGALGVLYAIAQHDLKRLLAYHSVENIGIIGLGIGMGMLGQSTGQSALVVLGYSGALLHVLNHALFKGLLFLSAGTILHGTGTGEMDRLGGLARPMPVNAALFLIAAVSICGLPPFNGFVSEWLLYGSLFAGTLGPTSLVAASASLGAVFLALMGGLALACFAKVFGVVFLGEPRDALIRPHSTAMLMRCAMVILAAACVTIGVLPGTFLPLARGGVVAVSHFSEVSVTASLEDTLAPIGRLTGLAAVLLVSVACLALLRRVLLSRSRRQLDQRVGTWGCGYAVPEPRMQYTASSFAWPLVHAFRYLLWPSRQVSTLAGSFSAPCQLHSHTPDMAEHDFFAPLWRGTVMICSSIRTVSWPNGPTRIALPRSDGERTSPLRELTFRAVAVLRRGSIHMCVGVIVITLLIVFLLGSLTSQGGAPASQPKVMSIHRPSEVSQ